jgi:hypothetical protein
MNTTEKYFYYASLTILFTCVILRVLHRIEPGMAMMLLVTAMSLYGTAYRRYVHRLKARNEALETELQSLRAQQ